MKKGLLIFAAAIMVALGASAQSKISNVRMMNAPVELESAMAVAATPSMSSSALSASKIAKVEASEGIAGTYIMDYYTTFKKEFVTSSEFTITNETGVMTPYYDEGGTPEDFNYNVKLTGFTYAPAVAYGYYDAEEQTLTIPQQTIYTNDKYGRIVLFGVSEAEGKLAHFMDGIAFDVEDDGTLSLITDTETEGEEVCGFYNYLVDYEDGGAWNFGFDLEVFVPNATMYYTTTGEDLGGNGSSWAKVQKRVNVEDWGTALTVHNFLGLCPISVDVDGNNVAIKYGQQVDDYDYTKDEVAYGYMKLVGCAIDGSSIKRNYDAKALNGFATKTGYDFYKTEHREAWTDEEGDHKEGDYFVDDDPNFIRYFAVATNPNEQGGAYSLGWCCNLYIDIDEKVDAAIAEGINEVNAASKSSKMTYNLMGQKVNGAVKGLVIRDGKKFVVK